ncbi:MAG: hypothetical protein H6874_01435 [Hyphomicrobiaceae bacterium]|nr:hypothetical protein [Hyphomicrobiaceae bacterium]
MLRHAQISQAINQGISRALEFHSAVFDGNTSKNYVRKSGSILRNEQILSSFIADSLRSNFGKDRDAQLSGFVTHETRNFVLDAAMALRQRQTSSSQLDDRPEPEKMAYIYDLVVWEGPAKPYAIVEVKWATKAVTVFNDAVKVCNALRRLGTAAGGTVNNAYLAFLMPEDNSGNMSSVIDDISERLKVENYTLGPVRKGNMRGEKKVSAAVVRISSNLVR